MVVKDHLNAFYLYNFAGQTASLLGYLHGDKIPPFIQYEHFFFFQLCLLTLIFPSMRRFPSHTEKSFVNTLHADTMGAALTFLEAISTESSQDLFSPPLQTASAPTTNDLGGPPVILFQFIYVFLVFENQNQAGRQSFCVGSRWTS